MDKHQIDESLVKQRNFHPPINRFVVFFASIFQKITNRKIDKSKFLYCADKINKVSFHKISLKNSSDKDTCLIYIHGGGFMFKEATYMYQLEQEYVSSCLLDLYSIDYRLSLKYQFPYQINECLNVFNMLKEKYQKFILIGDSAGASLVNDLYLSLNKVDKEKILGMLLIYPVVDNEMNTNSMKIYNNTPTWDNKRNKKMWKYYLKDNKYISPLKRIEEFVVDNVYIELCEYDCLHDEGYKLYQALKDKGCHVILNDTKGTFHGYDCNLDSSLVKKSIKQRVDFINKLL